MKRIVALVGLSLSLIFPVNATSLESKQPTVKANSTNAMGCMILLECTEGVEKLTAESEIFNREEFALFRDEIKRIVSALNALDVGIYLASERYFTPRTVGLYKPKYNRFFINEELVSDPREFLGTLRHEGWHTVQDCMAGGLHNSFMAQVHQDTEIPAWVMKSTKLAYESMMQSRAVPWEADANWAEEQSNATAEKLEMCVKGPLWEQITPTPMTKEWLVGCGWMKPQDGLRLYKPNKKSEYCMDDKD